MVNPRGKSQARGRKGKRPRIQSPPPPPPPASKIQGKQSILYGKFIVDSDFAGTDILPLFDRWSTFLHLHCDVQDKLVVEFYENLEVHRRSPQLELTSTVCGVNFVLTEETFHEIFKIPVGGDGFYNSQGWPEGIKGTETTGKVIKYMWEKVGPKDPDLILPLLKDVDVNTRLALKIMSEVILPRNINDGKIPVMDAYIYYSLREKKEIALPFLILQHMLHISGKGGGKTTTPGYGMALMHIFSHFNISSDAPYREFAWNFDMLYMNFMGIYWYNLEPINRETFKSLPQSTQAAIRNRTKKGTTFTNPVLGPTAQNLDDTLGGIDMTFEEDVGPKIEGEPDIGIPGTTPMVVSTSEEEEGDPEEITLRQVMRESRKQAHIDEHRRREVRRGAGSSSMGGAASSLMGQQEDPSLMAQILSQLQALNTGMGEMRATMTSQWDELTVWRQHIDSEIASMRSDMKDYFKDSHDRIP